MLILCLYKWQLKLGIVVVMKGSMDSTPIGHGVIVGHWGGKHHHISMEAPLVLIYTLLPFLEIQGSYGDEIYLQDVSGGLC